MKKFVSLLAIVMAVMLLFTACSPAATTITTVANGTTAGNTTAGNTTAGNTTAGNTTAGTTQPSASTTGTTGTTATTVPVTPPIGSKSIKVLAIGNSFSVDAMEHLAVILNDAGYEEILLGNLYIGGCSLDTHWGNISSGAKAYTFYLNTGKGWSSSSSDIQTGIDYADWDVITIQQVSQDSGRPETFGKLQNIIDHVKKTQADAKIYWHMTWAYQATSSHAGFANYGKNQAKMYNAITGAVKTNILTNNSIDGFIPSGTAIQNLRMTYGDTLTRDGFHLSNGIGRYTAALMWYKQLTGRDISGITAVPTNYPEIKDYLPEIKEAVNNAYVKPLEVTGENVLEDLTVMTDADKAYIKSLNLDPAKYDLLDLGLVFNAYYNSTSSPVSNNYSTLHATKSNSPQFMATSIFTSQMLPAGSVVKIEAGYQYRLEGWQTLSQMNALTRLDNSTENFVVGADVYTKYNFLAFNISKKDGSNVKLSDAHALRIYVPKAEKETPVMTDADKEYLTSKGLNPENYEKLDLGYELFAYYNATSGTTSNIINSRVSTASNLVNFVGTRIISKTEMPVGSVIKLDSGYQYRPERFVELGKSPAARGNNTTTDHIVVDASWWGSNNYVGFNVAAKGSSTVVSLETGTHFVIYVPKAN